MDVLYLADSANYWSLCDLLNLYESMLLNQTYSLTLKPRESEFLTERD